MLRFACSIPACPANVPGRWRILCHEHMGMVHPEDLRRLAAVWKQFRGDRRRDSYLAWHAQAEACIAQVLVALWEDAFTVPVSAHLCHASGNAYGKACRCGLPPPCACPLCAQARAVAGPLPSRRTLSTARVAHAPAQTAA